MKLNKQLLQDFGKSDSKLLAVTKYWDVEETNELLEQFWEEWWEVLIWLWENRVQSLKEKNLDREAVHFIWNIQTKEIKYITQHCATIHSLDNMKQIRKIDEICEKQWNWVKVFIQINLDSSKIWWISENKIEEFMKAIDETENISLVWFSWIWTEDCSDDERREEFQKLKNIRAKYLQNWIISAWTSRDYTIAIQEEIEIIRVWKSLVEK